MYVTLAISPGRESNSQVTMGEPDPAPRENWPSLTAATTEARELAPARQLADNPLYWRGPPPQASQRASCQTRACQVGAIKSDSVEPHCLYCSSMSRWLLCSRQSSCCSSLFAHCRSPPPPKSERKGAKSPVLPFPVSHLLSPHLSRSLPTADESLYATPSQTISPNILYQIKSLPPPCQFTADPAEKQPERVSGKQTKTLKEESICTARNPQLCSASLKAQLGAIGWGH